MFPRCVLSDVEGAGQQRCVLSDEEGAGQRVANSRAANRRGLLAAAHPSRAVLSGALNGTAATGTPTAARCGAGQGGLRSPFDSVQ